MRLRAMASPTKSRLVQIGDAVSAWTADLFAHPYMQIGVVALCIAWFALGLKTDLLTAALSILAITLTQMVLNSQKERECDDHRRDVAMHAKLDELLIAMKGARDEMAGIEDLDEEDIVQLKENAQERVEALGEELDGRAEERSAAS
jgi:low affinity Fe/Cu permease